MKAKFNWNSVNWLDQDVVIAKTLGCTREGVRQMRKKLGKEKSPYYHKRNFSILNKILELNTEKMTLEDIAGQMGCSKVYIRNILVQYKKPFIFIDKRKGGKYKWASVNWNLTDRENAIKLGVPNVGVVTGHRRRLGIFKERIKISAKKEINIPISGDSMYRNVLNLQH